MSRDRRMKSSNEILVERAGTYHGEVESKKESRQHDHRLCKNLSNRVENGDLRHFTDSRT